MKLFYVIALLATISSADSQEELQLTCTYLQFGVSYRIPSLSVLRTLAIDCTNGFSMDISEMFRKGLRKSTIPVPTSVSGGSNCTLSGTYRTPVTFSNYYFVDTFCNFPETEMSLPAEVSANISESTSINCNVTSSRYVNITWMKDGYPLIAEGNMEINKIFLDHSPNSLVSISTINFLAVQSSNSGWYNCTMANTNNGTPASTSVYLSVPKGPISTTEQFTPISTTIATTVATTGTQKDAFNHTVVYTTIGILLVAFVMVIFSLSILSIYCSQLRKERLNVQDFAAIHFPKAHEDDCELVNMKIMVAVSLSTPSLCLKLKTEHQL